MMRFANIFTSYLLINQLFINNMRLCWAINYCHQNVEELLLFSVYIYRLLKNTQSNIIYDFYTGATHQ